MGRFRQTAQDSACQKTPTVSELSVAGRISQDRELRFESRCAKWIARSARRCAVLWPVCPISGAIPGTKPP